MDTATRNQAARTALPVAAVAFVDLAGLPGWGSAPDPAGADLGTILERHLGHGASSIRLVQGCTAVAVFADVRSAVESLMDLLAESARTSGSATAGMHVTDDPVADVAPSSHAGRLAAALARLADADRLAVTDEVVAVLRQDDGAAALSFDDAPTVEVDAERMAAYTVRRR
jgi:hypothetical protein